MAGMLELLEQEFFKNIINMQGFLMETQATCKNG